MERIKKLNDEVVQLKARARGAEEREQSQQLIFDQQMEHYQIEMDDKFDAIRTRYNLLEEAYNNLLKMDQSDYKMQVVALQKKLAHLQSENEAEQKDLNHKIWKLKQDSKSTKHFKHLYEELSAKFKIYTENLSKEQSLRNNEISLMQVKHTEEVIRFKAEMQSALDMAFQERDEAQEFARSKQALIDMYIQ
jgi:hypothetical protein